MDRWISTAWKAFWVGLGASAVLVGQAVLVPNMPPPAAPAPVLEAPRAAPAPAPAAQIRVDRGSDPYAAYLSPARCTSDRC